MALTPEQTFQLFIARVDELMERRAVRENTVKASLTIGSKGSSMDLGDEEDRRSLLISFRPFVLQREPVFANHVFNLLERRLTDDVLRDSARHNRADWQQAHTGIIGLEVDGKKYTAEDCFDLVLNGTLFHLDQAKATELEALPSWMQSMVQHQTTFFAIGAIHILHATRNLIRKALDEGSLDLS